MESEVATSPDHQSIVKGCGAFSNAIFEVVNGGWLIQLIIFALLLTYYDDFLLRGVLFL